MTPNHILFLITAFIILASAVMMVGSKRMMYSALWLILTLFGVAVIFILLNNSFFAIVQVIIYIGAIAILIVFAIMLKKTSLTDYRVTVLACQWIKNVNIEILKWFVIIYTLTQSIISCILLKRFEMN